MNEELLGTTIKRARERLGWTQTDLAARIGVTPSFVTKLEKNEAVPSYERSLALSSVLVLDSEALLASGRRAKEEQVQKRNRTRGAVAGSAYRSEPGIHSPVQMPNIAEQIGNEIINDPDLQTAFTWLRAIIVRPELKAAILKTLEVFAKQCNAR